jgi:hypothetical protein
MKQVPKKALKETPSRNSFVFLSQTVRNYLLHEMALPHSLPACLSHTRSLLPAADEAAAACVPDSGSAHPRRVPSTHAQGE